MQFLNNMTPGKAAVAIIGGLVTVAIVALNAAFTYSYGASVVGAFLLTDILDPHTSAQLSGLTALLFFDIAYVTGILTLIFGCKSVWQYGIVGLQFAISFLLSIAASVVAIVLLSPLAADVGANTLETAKYVGYSGLIAGFVVNALAGIGYVVTMPSIAANIRHSVRQARRLATVTSVDNTLDDQSQALAQQQMQSYVPMLASVQAHEMLANYLTGLGFDVQQPGKRPSIALPSPDSKTTGVTEAKTAVVAEADDDQAHPQTNGKGLSRAAAKWLWLAENYHADGVGGMEWNRRVREDGHDPETLLAEINRYKQNGGGPLPAPWEELPERPTQPRPASNGRGQHTGA